MRTRSRPAAALLLAALLSAAGPVHADDFTPRKQALLLLRVLVYDRNLRSRAGGEVRVAVVFRAGNQGSEAQRDELVAALEEVSREVIAAGLPVKVLAVPYYDAADFEARLGRAAPACAFVGAWLEPMVKDVSRATQRHAVLSMSGSKEMVGGGLAIGLVNRGQRAGVVVNLRAARSEGADLDAALLGIAEVIP